MGKSIKPVFGALALGTSDKFRGEAITEDVFRRLEEGGCQNLDTGHDWPGSEEWLGKMKAGSRFTIDSKTPGGLIPGASTGANILRHAEEMVRDLQIKQVDIYNIHAPDPSLDLEDMLWGINEAYRAGYFKRFGLSNYTAKEVQRVYDICKAKGYPLPTAYQGNYSAIARKPETALFPTLRKLGIAFYAYSPLAGGMLTKTAEQIASKGEDAGRFGGEGLAAVMYRGIYGKPVYYKALELWAEAAKEAGCSKAELGYRWVACDSALSRELGDAILFGASTPTQVSEVLAWLQKGSVGYAACAKIDEIWKIVEEEAPLDNYNSYFAENHEDLVQKYNLPTGMPGREAKFSV